MTTSLEQPAISDKYDLRAPDLYRNPHALMGRMRAEDPVYWSRQLGSWVLTSYADVSAAMRDSRLSVVEETKRIRRLPESDQESLRPLEQIFGAWGGRAKWDEHARFVKLLKRFFTPQTVEAMRPRIHTILNDLIEASQRRGEMDVVNDVAHPMAMSVVTSLIGAPTSDVDMLLRCSAAISGLLEMGEREQLFKCQEGMLELCDFMRPVVAEHRKRRHADLLNVFVEADESGDPYSDEDIIAQSLMFLVVGYHTTANLLTNGLQILFDHPEERARLVNNFELMPNAFDEMMRFHGPVASVRRLALVDYEIRGTPIKEGDTVLLALCAANRDPDVFADPGRFDIAREGANRHVGFTIGPYSCMGQALARLEGAIFFRTMLERMPRLRPQDESPDWMAFRPFGCELRTLRVAYH